MMLLTALVIAAALALKFAGVNMILIAALVSLATLVILIAKVKLHPFLSLLLAALLMGLLSEMGPSKILAAVQAGIGNTLGFVAVVLALGAIIGKVLEETGAAETIAKGLADVGGKKGVHWAMTAVSFLVGLPVFFQVGFVLLAPIAQRLSKKTMTPAVVIMIAMLASLSTVHGLVPPHPAALAAVDIFKADLGKTLLMGIAVGLPTACVAGPLFASLWRRRLTRRPDPKLSESFQTPKVVDGESLAASNKERPGLLPTLVLVLMPFILIIAGSIADRTLEKGTRAFEVLKFLGEPITALLVAALLPCVLFGKKFKAGLKDLSGYAESSMPSIASLLLVIGAGGAFSKVLVESGAGKVIADAAATMSLPPFILGWLVAASIRVATGSSTVAMLTASGLVAPIIQAVPGTPPELMVLAVGAGSVMLSFVNDSGFWLVKEYFRLSIKETLMTWTALETLIGVFGLLFTYVAFWTLY